MKNDCWLVLVTSPNLFIRSNLLFFELFLSFFKTIILRLHMLNMLLHFTVMWKWCHFASASASRKIWRALPPPLPCFQLTSTNLSIKWNIMGSKFLTGFDNQDFQSSLPNSTQKNLPHNLKINTYDVCNFSLKYTSERLFRHGLSHFNICSKILVQWSF